MSQDLKRRVKLLGSYFEDKEAREELQSIINDWLHGKKDSEKII